MINKQSYQIQGMRQDNLVGTGFSSKYAHEIKNMRFNTIGDYTTASWTTEKGTKQVTVASMPMSPSGTYNWLSDSIASFNPIGQAVINDEWILFGKINTTDYVLNLHYGISGNSEVLYGRILYHGNLNFSLDYPIETLSFYENELVQKVYWTDGLNQPRVINIKGAEGIADGFSNGSNTQFDFTQEVSLEEEVTVKKEQSNGGMFPPGTVKYALTYYHKYGQETNVVYDSPLYYPTLGDRACSPDEISSDVFRITVNKVDTAHGFDYIRLYSIVRTSENATPIVRIVEDLPIPTPSIVDGVIQPVSVEFVDSNTKGRIVDPSVLYYLGGNNITVGTLAQKDNVLFLGDITLKNKSLNSTNIGWGTGVDNPCFYFGDDDKAKIIPIYHSDSNEVYDYVNELNSTTLSDEKNYEGSSFDIKIFKRGEWYRVGIQFQNETGKWSEVIRLTDLQCNIGYVPTEEDAEKKFPRIKYVLPNNACSELIDKGYKKARLVCCYTTNADRSVIAQGVINPTVSNIKNNNDNCPTAQSSWFFRPFGTSDIGITNPTVRTTLISEKEIQSILPLGAEVDLNSIRNTVADKVNTKGLTLISLPTVPPSVIAKEDYWSTDSTNTYYWGIDTSSDDIHNWGIKLPNNYEDYNHYYIANHGEDQQFEGLPELSPNVFSDCYNDLYDILDEALESYYHMISPRTSRYFINVDFWTLNSPDIEFDESFRTIDFNNLEVENIGGFDVKGRVHYLYLDATKPFKNYQNVQGTGLNTLNPVMISEDSMLSHDFDCWYWSDLDSYFHYYGEWLRKFPIYPFQRSTSLNTYVSDVNNWSYQYGNDSDKKGEYKVTQSAKISTKVFSTLLYSKNSYWNNGIDYGTPIKYKFTGNLEIRYFDDTPIIFNYDNATQIYWGNVNTISPVEQSREFDLHNIVESDDSKIWMGSYPLMRYDDANWPNRINWYNLKGNQVGQNDKNYMFASDPVSITYKSIPHIVIRGNMTKRTGVVQDDPEYSYYLTELHRDVPVDVRFGGTANKYNIYTPCGPSVALNTEGTIVYGYEGDHYFMRYDCLKTYPYSTEDVNQIVEIMSFMCETRINLDGRYDRNRGLVDNTTVLNTNFNLINKSYTQSNNFFSYTELRDDEIANEVDRFPNQITWTKPKVSGEETDAWTNITLASTADADGTVGSITKLINFNDRLLLFQEHGLSQITYNENTAISTEANIPLELAKTGKFTGFNYLSKEIGCQNKWSISQSKNGLFWIDDSRQELLGYTDSIKPLSTLNGFDAFMIKALPQTFTKWTPKDFRNFVTYYDKISNDIYYINNDTCLAWNEQTGSFTSFYDYEHVPYMINIGRHSLMWKNGVWAAREGDTYSTFFDSTKDYWMTIVCDGMTDKGSAFPADKVFNNIEYRADIYNLDGNNTNYATSVFNKKHVWNGYQNSTEVDLDGERKFNTWRIQLPRHYGTRDRIRNPFCYIKLKQDQTVNTQTDRMILHDLAVYFDMR